jgi:type IV fimbrial biogenesis protein FimT
MRTRQPKGFTLVELVVVVVISAILLTVGVPMLRDMVLNNRLIAAANDLVSHLNLARSEAVKRRRDVRFCSTPAPQASPPRCDGVAPDWGGASPDSETGWLVVADLDRDGVLEEWVDSSTPPDGEEDSPEIFRRAPAPAPGVAVHASTASVVTFRPDGTARPAIVFGVCDGRGAARGRQVQVEEIGRISSVKLQDRDPSQWPDARGCSP